MIFGDTSSFAIECNARSRCEGFIYCDFSFWINGWQIGVPEEESVLGVLIHSASIVMEYEGDRRLDVTDAMSADALWAYLDKVTRSDDPDMLRQSLEGHYLLRYCLHTIADDAVGSAFDIIVVDSPDGRQRLVWKSHRDDSVGEIQLPGLSVDRTIKDFLVWAEQA